MPPRLSALDASFLYLEAPTTPMHVGTVSIFRRPRSGFDYDRLFQAFADTAVPVLAFTTHALARQTQPWHTRCARVVTKETLTAELPTLLREGVPA